MTIATAVQRGTSIYLYNEYGNTIALLPCGSGPNDGLKGYTSSSVSVRLGPQIYIYNEKGNIVRVVPA